MAAWIVTMPDDIASRTRVEALVADINMVSFVPKPIVGMDLIESMSRAGQFWCAHLNEEGQKLVGMKSVPVHAKKNLCVPGTFGCAWSHHGILEEMSRRRYDNFGPFALILEDDARFGTEFVGNGKVIGSHLSSLLSDILPQCKGVDVIWLGGHPNAKKLKEKPYIFARYLSLIHI